MTDHYLIRHPYSGSYGDRPTPWEVTYTCGCGAVLLEDSEDRPADITAEQALQEHLEAMEEDQ